MPLLDRDGVRIYYDVAGEGPPMLFTHGFCATSRMWDAQVAALGAGHRVVRWDMRGHGRSDAPDDRACYSHALAVADMAAVLDACAVDRVVLVGLSLGGFFSLAFRMRWSERVRALVLMDTGPGYKSAAARATWNEYAEDRARALEQHGAGGLSDSPEVGADHHQTLTALPHVARGMLVQHDGGVIESLASIDVPTLLLVGAQDEPFLAGMSYMAKKIPGAVHVVVDDAGHAVNIDQPARVNAELTRFLAALDR